MKEYEKRDNEHFQNQKCKTSGVDDKSFARGYEFMKQFLRPNDTVIEAGCRFGQGCEILHNNCKTIYGFDVDESRINKATKKDNVIYECKDSVRTELPESDVVLTSSLFHHYPKRLLNKVFAHLSEKVKRDVMIFAPNGEKYSKEQFDKGNVGDHVYHPTQSDLERVAHENGFVLHALIYDHYPHYKHHFCLVFRKKMFIIKETKGKCFKFGV